MEQTTPRDGSGYESPGSFLKFARGVGRFDLDGRRRFGLPLEGRRARRILDVQGRVEVPVAHRDGVPRARDDRSERSGSLDWTRAICAGRALFSRADFSSTTAAASSASANPVTSGSCRATRRSARPKHWSARRVASRFTRADGYVYGTYKNASYIDIIDKQNRGLFLSSRGIRVGDTWLFGTASGVVAYHPGADHGSERWELLEGLNAMLPNGWLLERGARRVTAVETDPLGHIYIGTDGGLLIANGALAGITGSVATASALADAAKQTKRDQREAIAQARSGRDPAAPARGH